MEEIVSKGGALALVGKEDYLAWFITLPKDAQKLVCDAWGQPPGEEKDGVPPSMVFEGKMVITGVAYGNAIVCVQPKRGCAGARCDGQVCRILHDPEVPPPHQYLATYHWIEESFGADVMIHVGTHGNMEFLPGKSVALSASCFPDIAVGNVPYLYIYNADNPPEGAIAKRRSYAVIVDHMQTTMTASEIYGDLKELEDAFASYKQSKISEKGRAHASEHVIIDLLHAILRFDSEMKKFLSTLMDRPVAEKEQEALARQFISAFLVEEMDPSARILGDHLKNQDSGAISHLREKVMDISRRIEASLEMKSLLHGMEGGFIEPGPSGLITRGKPDVLPTGRNFYSLDPATVPSIAAWRVERKLAHLLITKYQEENGRIPENVAMYWMASDIMWAEGEQLAQMLFLLGVEPVWKGGRVTGYQVLSLDELRRPRIDITVRVSGITRDCFYNCIELLDSAIQEVAARDEPEEMNFIRKHFLQGSSASRIFASRPGTYGNGVNLAVYASAWKEEKDLTDVFMQWNSYAYGKDVFGQEATQALAAQLKSVDLTSTRLLPMNMTYWAAPTSAPMAA